MVTVYKILSFLPMLPLPGAAYFLMKAFSEERTLKKILDLVSVSTCLLISVSCIVFVLYIKALLAEGRAKHNKTESRNKNVKKGKNAEEKSVPLKTEVSSGMGNVVSKPGGIPMPSRKDPPVVAATEKSCESFPTADQKNPTDEPGEEPDHFSQSVHTGYRAEQKRHPAMPERTIVEIVNMNVIQNSSAPAILEVSSDSSSMFLLDPNESYIWINEKNLTSSYSRRQLNKYGISALYQLFDENNIPISETKKYVYVMIPTPCLVEKLSDGSYRVTKKGTLIFHKC